MKIFISYSSKDGKDFAGKLHEIMHKHGHDPFLVDHDTLKGEKLWSTISTECLNRDRSIFVLTPSSLESKGQQQEYDLITSFYIKRLALIHSKCNSDTIFAKYPFLKPYLAAPFDDSTFESDFAQLAVDLVKLQDQEGAVTTRSSQDEGYPKLSQEGLDESEIKNCIRNLNESFQMETVIPEICRTRAHDEKSSLSFATIGVAHRLPVEWFKTDRGPILNDFLFRDFGRSIALGERAYLHENVIKNGKIHRGKFSPEGILEAVACIQDGGFHADIIFPQQDCWMAMHHWHDGAHLEYSSALAPSRPHLNASLVLDKTRLGMLSPLGNVPDKTIIFSSRAITWHAKMDPEQGAILVVLGRDRLYPMRYAELIAQTRVNIEMHPEGFFILET